MLLRLAISFLIASTGASLAETRLLMIDQAGCEYCARWDAEVGVIYEKTAEGRRAPLLRTSIRDPLPNGVTLTRRAIFTPTFVLLQDGAEVGRIEGYPGEDFFYGLLGQLLDKADKDNSREENMKKTLTASAFTAFALIGSISAAGAQESQALVEFKSMKPEVAVALAQAALATCRNGGYQVAVAVVDRFGQTQAVIRDRYAGAHTVDTATSKAWTAASFRTGTLALDTLIEEGGLSRSLRDVPGALILGGGVPVEAAGSIVGAVGVSGAPGPDIDEECALAGVEAVADQLEF